MSTIKGKPDSNSCGSCGSPSPGPSPQGGTAVVPKELHACMGLNACKGHDRFGTNECAGRGSCATQQHVCHTLNNCRGQGGCGLYGSAEEQCRPGANACAFQGSCATPIQAERFATEGPNAGKSVWLLARRLFEGRMKEANRDFGPSPYPCGPPEQWLNSLGPYDSCGSSGDKYCTFGFNSPARNAQELCDNSRAQLPETLEDCSCKK